MLPGGRLCIWCSANSERGCQNQQHTWLLPYKGAVLALRCSLMAPWLLLKHINAELAGCGAPCLDNPAVFVVFARGVPQEVLRSPLAHRQGQAEESAERQELHRALQEQAAAADKLRQELAAAQRAAEASQQAAQASQQAQLQAQQELLKQVSPGPESLREGASHT